MKSHSMPITLNQNNFTLQIKIKVKIVDDEVGEGGKVFFFLPSSNFHVNQSLACQPNKIKKSSKKKAQITPERKKKNKIKKIKKKVLFLDVYFFSFVIIRLDLDFLLFLLLLLFVEDDEIVDCV